MPFWNTKQLGKPGFFEPPTAAAPNFQSVWNSFWFDTIPGVGVSLRPFQMGGDTSLGFHLADPGNVYADVCYSFATNNGDPVRNVFVPGSFDDRDSGTVPAEPPTFHLADSVVVPDASPGNTPNNPTIILNTTTSVALCLNAFARPVAAGNMWGYVASPAATHGGSYTLGGEVSLTELNTVIPHAVPILFWGEKYLSNNGTGYVSPAQAADNGFDDPLSGNYYGGADTNFKMGSRFSIPSSVTAASLGITSTAGQALLTAIKTYGAYIIDNTAFDGFAICTTPDAEATINGIGSEINALFGAMQIVLSGSAWVPSTESGLVLWLKSDTGITKDGSNFVSNWANQASTGSSYDAAQSTGGLKPLWVSGALNSYPAIRFDGVDDFLSFSGSALDMAKNVGGITVFAVWKSASGVGDVQNAFIASRGTDTGSARVKLFREASADGNLDGIGGRRLDADSFVNADSSGDPGTGYIVTVGVFDYTNNTMTLYRNGVQVGQTTSAWGSGGNTSNTSSLSMLMGKTTAGQFANMDMVEFGSYNVALALGAVNRVSANLRYKYAV